MARLNFLTQKASRIHRADEIESAISRVVHLLDTCRKGKDVYYNIPCSFDIETSSFYDHCNKIGIMWIWCFNILGEVIVGRTWDEFEEMNAELVRVLELGAHKVLPVYVHNLAFDFQFFRSHIDVDKVFAVDRYKPLYARTFDGFEYRCSYQLSGYSLVKLGEQLHRYKLAKKTGDLDYDLIRHSKTPVSDAEMDYLLADTDVVVAYIQELIIERKRVTAIPYTKTGFVREYCRNNCFYPDGIPCKKSYKRLRYKDYINDMYLTPDEYAQLRRAFQGGFTHANPFVVGKVYENVTSVDITSSYPTVMVSEQFPCEHGEVIDLDGWTLDQIENTMSLYCCLFDVEICDLRPVIHFENYLSRSKCWDVSGAIYNNGRIVYADTLRTTITEQDYFILKRFYNWSKIRFYNFRRYHKAYLHKDFVMCLMQMYQDKTVYKDVADKAIEYQQAKERFNASYGMSVQRAINETVLYDAGQWTPKEDYPDLDVDAELQKYNKAPNRFLYYAWGVWVTAYARRNIISAILACGDDYLYCDTDSVKILNYDRHKAFFDGYNDGIVNKIDRALSVHKIPLDMARPVTSKGVTKQLGVFDFDGHYTHFKTLGAKRYLVKYSEDQRNDAKKRGKYVITVAGLGKKSGVEYLLKEYGNGIFEHFCDDMKIPAEHTGKLTHTYIDEPRDGIVIDYTGISAEYHERTSVHLEKVGYNLTLVEDYIAFLEGLEDAEYF